MGAWYSPSLNVGTTCSGPIDSGCRQGLSSGFRREGLRTLYWERAGVQKYLVEVVSMSIRARHLAEQTQDNPSGDERERIRRRIGARRDFGAHLVSYLVVNQDRRRADRGRPERPQNRGTAGPHRGDGIPYHRSHERSRSGCPPTGAPAGSRPAPSPADDRRRTSGPG
jgi:hypothetical protein